MSHIVRWKELHKQSIWLVLHLWAHPSFVGSAHNPSDCVLFCIVCWYVVSLFTCPDLPFRIKRDNYAIFFYVDTGLNYWPPDPNTMSDPGTNVEWMFPPVMYVNVAWTPWSFHIPFHCLMNSMKLVIPLHSLYWSIHTKDESKSGTTFAFIFGVNWLWRCGVTALFGFLFSRNEM